MYLRFATKIIQVQEMSDYFLTEKPIQHSKLSEPDVHNKKVTHFMLHAI